MIRVCTLLFCLACAVPLAATAQQFDNFGEGPLDGFELGDGTAIGEVPSLGGDGTLPDTGDGIILDLSGGNADVSLEAFPGAGSPVTSVSQPETSTGSRVILRALDRTLGRPTDVDMAIGETVVFGRIAIRAVECRYPASSPSSDAYGHVEILDTSGNSLFDAWMIASSPALSALEHPRYDVWVLRCLP